MLLLSDGTVMAANNDGVVDGQAWYRLTPDGKGSYVNGTWSVLASMNYTRLFYSSDVLSDGRVFVAGGEFGSGAATAEIYSPWSNIWTVVAVPGSLLNPNNASPALASGNQGFYDSVSETISNGNVLIAPVGPRTFGGTLIYNPLSNAWAAGPQLLGVGYQDEASWVKLPDQSILTIDPFSSTSERYIPGLNKWVRDADVPLVMYDTNGELGAALLLPSGKALFIGGSGNTAIYTPSGSTNAGTWIAGPVVPNAQGAADAPAAMMANGKILCLFNPVNTYNTPSSFFEYDPAANSFSPADGPGNLTNLISAYQGMMLDLPDGNVLFSAMGSQLYVYQPAGSPLASGQPSITSITTNSYANYHLIGTRLNGLSEGAAYGDDNQMASNYPLVRLTDSAGNVYYARTFNWSSTGVMTGNTPVSTDFTLPTGLPAGSYSLVVVANGISSSPVPFVFAPDALAITPNSGFAAAGPLNGPFSPGSQSYTLQNAGISNLNWALANFAGWLSFSPTNGALASNGGTISVSASLTAQAANLPAGAYAASVWISNLTSGAAQNLQFTLEVQPLVQNGGFETGDFTAWTLSGNNRQNFVGNANTDRAYVHSGDYGALMGQNAGTALLSQPVAVDSGAQYVLSFWLTNPKGGTPNSFEASFDGISLFKQVNMGTFGWINEQFLVTPADSSATLTFTIQNNSDSFGLDDISLEPYKPSTNAPVFVWQPVSQSVFAGATATLSASASGTFPLSYQWLFNSTKFPNATNSSLILTNASVSQSGTYVLVVSNAYGATASSGATITVKPQPLVADGGFETGDFGPWNFVGDTNSSFVGDAADYPLYVHSGNYAALFGQGGSLARVSQTISTLTGQIYLLSFWLANPVGGTPNEAQVLWNGNLIFDQKNSLAFDLTNVQMTVAATSASSVLAFGFRNDPDFFGLDDVNLYPIPQMMASEAAGVLSLTWSAQQGASYQAQFASNPASGVWTNLGAPVIALTTNATVTDSITNVARFYRVVELLQDQ